MMMMMTLFIPRRSTYVLILLVGRLLLSSNLVILTNPESIQTMGDQEYYHMPVEHPAMSADFLGSTGGWSTLSNAYRTSGTMMGRRLIISPG
jgi:hypothetical protein